MPKKQFVGERTPNRILDQALHRTRTHQGIEALFSEVGSKLLGEDRFNFFLMQLLFELHQEFVNHAQDDVFIERRKTDDVVEAIAKLGREHPFDFGHFIAWRFRTGKADRALLKVSGTGIGRHDDDDVSEVGFATVVIRQRAMIHHL